MTGGSGTARARIVDVAALAGVSAQTVSNVINGRGGFSEATRVRVESAIEKLGFQPNRYAQGLRSRRMMLLGFDLSERQLDVGNPAALSFLRALVRAASGHGYRVIALTHEEESGLRDLRTSADSGVVDAFVLADSPPEDQRARMLTELGTPFVVFGRTATDLPQSWVDIDNRAAMAEMVDYLLGCGHRSFAYVGYPNDVYWNAERYAGARERLRDSGIDISGERTVLGAPEQVRPVVLRLLQRPDRPQVLVTSSDAIAVVVANVATSLGLRVGGDVAVTGFDAGPLRTLTEPPLTSVRIPLDRIAEALVDRLILELRRPSNGAGVILPTDLVIGGSA